MNRTLGIVKFGKPEHMQLLLDGVVHMKSLAFYSSFDGNREQADIHEGDSEWIRGAVLSIGPKAGTAGPFLPVKGLADPLVYRDGQMKDLNVFCTYALDGDLKSSGINSRVLDFGDAFVLITHGDEFINRIQRAANAMDQETYAKRVHYVDEQSYHGNVGPFIKSDNFAHQMEFRIVLAPGFGHQVDLQIGDIRDIAIAGKSKDLTSRLGFDPSTDQLIVST